MKVINIKNRGLRRLVLVALAPFVVFEYLYIGLRLYAHGFKGCWAFQYPPEAT